MREILFRGKRLKGGAWVEGYFFKSDINERERKSGKATLIFTPDCDTFIMIPEAHNSVMVHGDTVGQFTGLTDKNGKRIFEGDICKGINILHPSRKIYQAGFEDGLFGLYDDGGTLWHYDHIDDVEVIGNIYDNRLEGDE